MIPSTRMLVGDRKRLLGEVLATELRQLDLHAVRDLVGEVRLDRLQREPDDLDAVGEVDRDVALVADEEQPVRLRGRFAEDVAELPRLDHGVDNRLEQRPRRDQVGRPTLDQLHDDLDRDDLADLVVGERLGGVLGEAVAGR